MQCKALKEIHERVGQTKMNGIVDAVEKNTVKNEMKSNKADEKCLACVRDYKSASSKKLPVTYLLRPSLIILGVQTHFLHHYLEHFT